jgi:hypothetical protein
MHCVFPEKPLGQLIRKDTDSIKTRANGRIIKGR